MLAEVWRHHNFSGMQCRVCSNDCGSLFQACNPVRLTPRRRESLLKVCEVGARFIVSVCWMAQCHSSLVFLVGSARSQVITWPMDTGQVMTCDQARTSRTRLLLIWLRLCRPSTLILQQILRRG